MPPILDLPGAGLACDLAEMVSEPSCDVSTISIFMFFSFVLRCVHFN